MAVFSGCFGKKYRIDFNGDEGSFANAKESYKAGERVTLYYNFIATDTNYSFYIDGERINPDYNRDKGFIISFIMPEHNVSIIVESRNSMLCEDEKNKSATLTFDSFDGGGPQYTVKLTELSVVSYDQIKKYHRANHDEMFGSGYDVIITFFGLKPGKTVATIECLSPIADNYDAVYDIEVTNSLDVIITKKDQVDIIQ